MTDEAWIEQSLARLETLEAQKAQHEAAGGPVPPQLQEEIATLYEALESAADDGGAAEAAPAPLGAPAFQPDAPFAAPAMAPAGAAPVMVPAAMAPMEDYGDDDYKPKGKGGLIAVAAVAVLALGAGGYWYTQQNKPAPAPEPVGEAKVIGASSVPEDTQEPQAAKGGDADRTPGTDIPEGSPSKPSAGGNSAAKKRPRPATKKKDDGRKVDISDSRDPLAGI